MCVAINMADPVVPASEYYNLKDLNKVCIDSSTSITMLVIKMCSIPRHLDQFSAEFYSLGFSIMGLSKTSLTSSTSQLYKIPSYDMFTQIRSQKGRRVE